jgi:hypothetical protein
VRLVVLWGGGLRAGGFLPLIDKEALARARALWL